jgi:hypothetical protein
MSKKLSSNTNIALRCCDTKKRSSICGCGDEITQRLILFQQDCKHVNLVLNCGQVHWCTLIFIFLSD